MSKLTSILEDMLAQAKKQAGVAVRRTLGRGLRIELMCVSSDVRLTLGREGQFPSREEWQTVTDHFPYPVPKGIEPAPDQRGNQFTITARFASQRVMQMKF